MLLGVCNMGNKNKLPDMLTKEQLVKLFENMYIPKCSIACFMALMCGLRIREICSLEVQDIDLQRRQIKVKDSKNPRRKQQGDYGKDRIIPFPEAATNSIKKWLSIIEGGKYFISSDKSPDKPLRTKTLHEWFKEARKRANLDLKDYEYTEKKTGKQKAVYKFRFHHLRHYYAQYVYERTRDLYAVAGLLGHNQITTTQIYAKISDKTKKETVDFAFNIPMQTKIISQNPSKSQNYNIPTIAISNKQKRSPVELLEERFAKGEISASDFQTALRLLKVRKDYLNENETNKSEEIKYN